jgi:hypothetical protein
MKEDGTGGMDEEEDKYAQNFNHKTLREETTWET